MNRPVIEGLPSPANSAPNAPRPNAAPAFKVDLARSVRMRPMLAAGVALCVAFVILAYALTRRPMYEAESRVYVDPVNSKVLGEGGGGYDPARYDSYLQQQIQTATRPDTLAAAIDTLPKGTWRNPGETMQSAVDRLQNSLKVSRVQGSYQLAIVLDMANASQVAAVVNAVTDEYLRQGRKDEHTISDQRLVLLGEERQRVQNELDQDKAESAQLGTQLGIANPVGDAGASFDVQLTGLRQQLADARQAHDVAAAQLASVSGGAGSSGLAATAEDAINTDAGLSSMKSALNSRKASLSSQMAGLTPSNPVYKQDQEEIADLDRSEENMSTELRDKAERRLQDKLRLELQRTGNVEATLNSQLAHETAIATGATPRLQRSAELAADIQRLTLRYAAVDDAIRGIKLETSGPGLAHLSVAATVPVAPAASRRSLMLLFALPLGILAGLSAAVLLHKRDPRLYTGQDVEEVLGFLPIGVMPARAEVSDAVLEEYGLRLAAGLASAYRISAARSFVLSSASPSSEIDRFTLLLRRQLETLGFRAAVVQAADLLLPIRTGSPANTASGELAEVEVLAAPHEGYASLHLERLRSESDVLLIEAPPLLHSAETEYLVRCADATLIIAECGVTLRPELYQCAVLLQRLNVAGVGAVLQELHLRVADPSFQRAIALLEERIATGPMAPSEIHHQSAEPYQAASPEPVAPAAVLVAQPEPEITPVLEQAPQQQIVLAPAAELAVTGTEPDFVEKEPVIAASDAVPFQQNTEVPEDIMFEEPKRNWFERLFSRQSDPIVSILPDHDQDPEAEAPSFEPALRSSIPAQSIASPEISQQEQAYDLPPRESSTRIAAAPVAPVSTPAFISPPAPPVMAAQPLAPAPLQHVAMEQPRVPSPPVRPMSFQQLNRSEPAAGQPELTPAAAPEPLPSQISNLPAVLETVHAPVVAPAVEPVVAQQQLEPKPAQPLLHMPAAISTPSPLQPDSAPGAPVTTGRWEPALVPRLIPLADPVRSDSGSHRPLPIRPVTVTREPAAQLFERQLPPVPPASAQRSMAEQPRPLPARPAPVRTADLPERRPGSHPTGNLSRRWELLSQFDKPNPGPEREADPEIVAAGSRHYRGSR